NRRRSPAPRDRRRESVTAEAAALAAPAAKTERATRFGAVAGSLWSGALLALLGLLVLYPVAMLLLGALTNTNPVVDGFGVFDLSLANFLTVLANPNVHLALANSLLACTGGTALAVIIGLTFSWIVVRTNTPCRGFVAAASLIPLFVPPLVAGVAWSILGSPKSGLINTLMGWAGIPWRIDLYSMTGLIVVFGMYYAPYVYMFTASALRNMDPSLEEAAEIAGVGPVRTLFTITFPLIAPAIISGMLLSFIVMLGIYGIPAVLGAPGDPTLALIVAAFRRFLFIPNVGSLFDMRHYSLVHFDAVFDNPLTMRSIWNTMEVGLMTAVVGGIIAFAIGYTVHRSNAPARRAIDLVATLPVAIPGLVIGVAHLWAWIGLPGGLYGTIWILALAFVARFMPDTMKSLSTSFLQIHRELEEAAWISGKGRVATIRTIVLPLARPGTVAAMTLLFILAIRELGSSLFLYTSDPMVMAVLLLDYYEGGNT